MGNTRLVYSTESGRICPSCGHPTTKCTCKKKKTAKKQSIYPNDGIVRISREVKGRKGKTVTAVFGIPLDDKKLEQFAKTFPDKFFENMFRLKGWQYRPLSVKRPGIVGHYINDIIYSRLVPGVLNKLNELNPKTPRGYRKHRHFQWLTDDHGVPELREHLSNVIFLMETHTKWDKFRWALNRAAPKYGDTMPLPLKATKEESE